MPMAMLDVMLATTVKERALINSRLVWISGMDMYACVG